MDIRFPSLPDLTGNFPAHIAVEAPRGLLAKTRFHAIAGMMSVPTTETVVSRWPDGSKRWVHLHGDFRWEDGTAEPVRLITGAEADWKPPAAALSYRVEVPVAHEAVMHEQAYEGYVRHTLQLRFMEAMRDRRIDSIRIRLYGLDVKRLMVRWIDKHPEQAVEQEGEDTLLWIWKPSSPLKDDTSLANLPRYSWLTNDSQLQFNAPKRVVDAITKYKADPTTAGEFSEHALTHMGGDVEGVGVSLEFAILRSLENADAMRQAYKVGPIGLAVGKEQKNYKPAIEAVLRSGPKQIEKWGLYGLDYGRVPTVILQDRLSNHRSGSQHAHYSGLSTAWRLAEVTGNSDMVDWARVLTRYHVDMLVRWKNSPGMVRRERSIPFAYYYEYFQHGIDTAGLLDGWRIGGMPVAKEAFELWEANASERRFFDKFMRVQSAYREMSGAMVQCLAAYEYTGKALWLDRVKAILPKLLVEDVLNPQLIGQFFHPYWVARYLELRSRELSLPEVLPWVQAQVAKNRKRIGRLPILYRALADAMDIGVDGALSDIPNLSNTGAQNDGYLPIQQTYLPERHYFTIAEPEEYPAAQPVPNDIRTATTILIDKTEDKPLRLTFDCGILASKTATIEVTIVTPSGARKLLTKDLLPNDCLRALVDSMKLPSSVEYVYTPRQRERLRAVVTYPKDSETGTYQVLCYGAAVGFTKPLQKDFNERVLMRPGVTYLMRKGIYEYEMMRH
jgi:hypothetical protein